MDIINGIVAIAEKLSQGGPTLMLLMFCGLLIWAVVSIFKIYKTSNDETLKVLTTVTATIDANTQIVARSIDQSNANRLAIEALTKALLERRGR